MDPHLKPIADLAAIIGAMCVMAFLALLPMVFRKAQLQLQRERIADQDRAIEAMREELGELREKHQRDRERLELLIRREQDAEARLIQREARLYMQERYLRRLEHLVTESGRALPKREDYPD